jgi:hypothetical protein
MNRSRMIRGFLGSVALLSLVIFVGCGGDSAGSTTRVSGTVMLNGGPIPPGAQASISFVPINENRGVVASAEIKDGKFEVPDAPVGPVRVEFSISQMTGESRPADDGRTGGEVVVKNLLPESVRNGIEKSVSADQPEMSFDLK